MVVSPARALRNSGIYRTPIPSPTCLTRLGNKTDGGTCNQNPRKPGEDMTILLKKNLLIKDFASLNTRTAKGHRFRTTSHKQARLNPSIQYYIYIYLRIYIFSISWYLFWCGLQVAWCLAWRPGRIRDDWSNRRLSLRLQRTEIARNITLSWISTLPQ